MSRWVKEFSGYGASGMNDDRERSLRHVLWPLPVAPYPAKFPLPSGTWKWSRISGFARAPSPLFAFAGLCAWPYVCPRFHRARLTGSQTRA